MPLIDRGQAPTPEFWAEHWKHVDPVTLAKAEAATPLAAMIRRWLPPPPCHVLDAGCGVGQWGIILRAWGYDYTGVDHTLGHDMADLPCPDSSVDAYLSIGAWEHHEPGPMPFALEARRILRPGGRLLVSVPYANLRRRLTGPTLGSGPFYQYRFSRSELAAIARSARFHVLRLLPYGIGYTVSDFVPAPARRRFRPFSRLPGLSLALAHMVLLVAEKP